MTKKIYLAGAMRRKGRWRDRETKWFQERSLVVFNPWVEEVPILQKYDIDPKLMHSGNSHKLDDKTKKLFYSEVLKYDFSFIKHKVRFLIVRFAEPTVGTCGEMGLAFSQNIPIHVVNVSGKKPPHSLIGFATTIHENFDQLHNYLRVKYRLKKTKQGGKKT